MTPTYVRGQGLRAHYSEQSSANRQQPAAEMEEEGEAAG